MIQDILDLISDVFDSIVDFLTDLPKLILQEFLSAVAGLIGSIPLPSFMSEFSLGSLIPSDIAWFLSQTSFGEGLLIIGAGYVFYFTRRVLTMGIW